MTNIDLLRLERRIITNILYPTPELDIEKEDRPYVKEQLLATLVGWA